jgi:hypothetical protein
MYPFVQNVRIGAGQTYVYSSRVLRAHSHPMTLVLLTVLVWTIHPMLSIAANSQLFGLRIHVVIDAKRLRREHREWSEGSPDS